MVDAQYERRGVAPEFRKEAFRYDETADMYVCPVGKELHHINKDTRRPGITKHMYRSSAAYAACALRVKCFPRMKKQGRQIMRIVEHPVIVAFYEKMGSSGNRVGEPLMSRAPKITPLDTLEYGYEAGGRLSTISSTKVGLRIR